MAGLPSGPVAAYPLETETQKFTLQYNAEELPVCVLLPHWSMPILL